MNIDKLEDHFKDMHTIKMLETTQYEVDQLRRMTNDTYKIDTTCFETIHESYADVRKEMAKCVYQAIHNKIYHIK